MMSRSRAGGSRRGTVATRRPAWGLPARDREPGAEDAVRAIRFDHISKRFPGAPRPAVDDCSFRVEAGAFVVLLGPSGCGKTTLLKMVNRLYEPTGGTIFLDDTDVRRLPVTALRR